MKVCIIPLTKGKCAIVDPDDYTFLSQWRWRYHNGYACRNHMINGERRHISMHRLVTWAAPHEEVDHRNTNKLDNRKSNLRICTRTDNARNRPLPLGVTGFKGVRKMNKRFEAYIRENGRQRHLGMFDTAEDAARKYNERAKVLHGEFAALNEIGGDV